MKVTLTKSVSKYGWARLIRCVSKRDTRGVHNNYCYEFLKESLDIPSEEFEKKKLWVFFLNSTTQHHYRGRLNYKVLGSQVTTCSKQLPKEGYFKCQSDIYSVVSNVFNPVCIPMATLTHSKLPSLQHVVVKTKLNCKKYCDINTRLLGIEICLYQNLIVPLR